MPADSSDSDALYQGPTLVAPQRLSEIRLLAVPFKIESEACEFVLESLSCSNRTPAAKAAHARRLMARLKPCPSYKDSPPGPSFHPTEIVNPLCTVRAQSVWTILSTCQIGKSSIAPPNSPQILRGGTLS